MFHGECKERRRFSYFFLKKNIYQQVQLGILIGDAQIYTHLFPTSIDTDTHIIKSSPSSVLFSKTDAPRSTITSDIKMVQKEDTECVRLQSVNPYTIYIQRERERDRQTDKHTKKREKKLVISNCIQIVTLNALKNEYVKYNKILHHSYHYQDELKSRCT